MFLNDLHVGNSSLEIATLSQHVYNNVPTNCFQQHVTVTCGIGGKKHIGDKNIELKLNFTAGATYNFLIRSHIVATVQQGKSKPSQITTQHQ